MPAQVTGFSTYPQRTQPATFAADMDTHIAELGSFINELNTVANEVNDSTLAAANSATSAETYALALEGAASATKWLSGTAYAQGAKVWSPTDFQDYRARTAFTSNTDPANDLANWARVSQKENADTVDNFHASQTPASGQATVLNSSGVLDLAAGAGLQLPNVANGGNTVFDWYERNITLNPSIAGSTGAGVGTYTIAAGRASRKGNEVSGTITLAWTAHTGTGVIKVMGLPFVSSPTANMNYSVRVQQSGLVVGSNKQLAGAINPNTNYILLQADDVLGGASSGVPMDTAVALLTVTFFYEV